VREAVLQGLNVLDVDYEKLDVDVANSDSDDDDDVVPSAKTPIMFERKVCLLFLVVYNVSTRVVLQSDVIFFHISKYKKNLKYEFFCF